MNEAVRIALKKYGRQGVVVSSQRGTGGWEQLGIDLNSPYLDDRTLLTPGQPEVRQYRLQFFDNDKPTGDFSDTATVTVGP